MMPAESRRLTSLRILEVKPAVAGVKSGVRSVSYGIVLFFSFRQHSCFQSLLENLLVESGWLMVQRRKWGGKCQVDVKVEVD